jgi:cytochrome c peroxidase
VEVFALKLMIGKLNRFVGASALCLMPVVCGWAESAHAPEPAAKETLAPGYGQLNFKAPPAGTYELPPMDHAADGKVIRDDGLPAALHSLFDDKVVVLSFIYSSCNDVNGCPLATAVLHKVRQRLAQHPELMNEVKLVSLSFDPAHDTPDVMRLYGAAFKSEGLHWDFATTASDADLNPILKAYNQSIIKDYDADGKYVGTISHILRVYLIDKERRIRNIYSVSFLHPDILINDIRTLMIESKPVVADKSDAGPKDVVYRAGDNKDGYHSTDYQTRSVSLTERSGKPVDFFALVQNPPLGLPPVPVPESNPLTGEKIALGRKLFFDRRLSLNDTISCAMCHVPEQGFTHNELETAVGIEGRTVRRNAPTVYNVAYFKRLFHDGREHALENQIWQPLLARNEMNNPSMGMVIEKINKLPDYEGLFEAAFRAPPDMLNIGMAIASYERSLISGNSSFDRWHFGKDQTALNESAQRGFKVFTGKGNCSACHLIEADHALFTDNKTHNTGIGYHHSMLKEPETRNVQLAPGVFTDVRSDLINEVAETKQNDLGVYEATQNPADRWKYRTPSLRNVALTAPYMHNGSLPTLKDVVKHYNEGGVPHEVQDPLIRRLDLTETEATDLVSFLESLTGSNVNALVSDAFAAPIGDTRKQDPNWSHENRIEY